jgi:hypothetical protein
MSRKFRGAREDSPLLRFTLSALAIGFVGLFLLMPLVLVFAEALDSGFSYFLDAIKDPDALAAIRLTLIAAVICVPLNAVFGVAASWLIAKFEFPGKGFLTALIDLPYAISPVIAGMIFVLVFGLQGWLGAYLRDCDVKIVFALPGIILATLFVTFPFRGARTYPADAGPRPRRGRSGDLARRHRLPDFFPGDAAQYQMGHDVRRALVQRTGDGRIRRGIGDQRSYSRAYQYHAAARRSVV